MRLTEIIRDVSRALDFSPLLFAALLCSALRSPQLAVRPSQPPMAPSFVHEHVRPHAAPLARPHVTLTWAQSLDSKIAGVGGKRVILSGAESMLMTHQSVPPSLQRLADPPAQPEGDP